MIRFSALATILSYEHRSYWRRFARSGLRAGNQGITIIFAAIVFGKYLTVLWTAATGVAEGNMALLESLLSVVLLAWLFPLANNSNLTLASRKWLHLPLTLSERFVVRVASLWIPPAAWMVIFGSLAILYPLGHASKPALGIVAGFLFIAMSCFTGLTISHLVAISHLRKVLWLVLVSLVLVIGLNVFSGAAPNLSLYPAIIVSRVANGKQAWFSLVVLVAMTIVSAIAAVGTFRVSLNSVPQGVSQRLMVFRLVSLPGRLGGLVAKDFSYFRRVLDTHMGLAVALLADVYLVVAGVPSPTLFWSLIVVVFLLNAALAFNSFGLENLASLSRYSIFPLSGRSILVSKSLAFVLVLAVQVVPMIVLAGWRLGIGTSALGLLEAVMLACAYLAWGNWMSVNHPLKMHFFRFANSGAALADSIAGIVFGSLPGILLIYVQGRYPSNALAVTVLLLAFFGTVYWLSLVRFGDRLDNKREQIAAVLSG